MICQHILSLNAGFVHTVRHDCCTSGATELGTVLRLTFCICIVEPVYAQCGKLYSSDLDKSMLGLSKNRNASLKINYCDTHVLLHLWCHTRTVLRLTFILLDRLYAQSCTVLLLDKHVHFRRNPNSTP